MWQKLKIKDLFFLVLQTLNNSNLTETSSAKSTEALELSEWLLELMLATSSLAVFKNKAFTWLELFPASLMALAGEGSDNLVLNFSFEDMSTRAEGEASYLLLLFRALVPSSSSSLAFSSSMKAGLSSAGYQGDPIGGSGTPLSVTRSTSQSVAPCTIVGGGK